MSFIKKPECTKLASDPWNNSHAEFALYRIIEKQVYLQIWNVMNSAESYEFKLLEKLSKSLYFLFKYTNLRNSRSIFLKNEALEIYENNSNE